MAKNRIEIWFKDWDNVYKQLPVNPESVSIESPFGLNTVNIASLGDVVIPGERGLKHISFSSFFPRNYNASYCEYEGFDAPFAWVDQIEAWRDTRKNIRLIITGTPVSIPVFVDSFTIEPERGGAPGDIYYSITLTEYRPIKAKIIQDTKPIVKGATTQTQRPSTQQTQAKSHTVAKGDSLWKIAKEVYGDGSKWKTIYDANKSVIGNNPDLIKPGQKLVFP